MDSHGVFNKPFIDFTCLNELQDEIKLQIDDSLAPIRAVNNQIQKTLSLVGIRNNKKTVEDFPFQDSYKTGSINNEEKPARVYFEPESEFYNEIDIMYSGYKLALVKKENNGDYRVKLTDETKDSLIILHSENTNHNCISPIKFISDNKDYKNLVSGFNRNEPALFISPNYQKIDIRIGDIEHSICEYFYFEEPEIDNYVHWETLYYFDQGVPEGTFDILGSKHQRRIRDAIRRINQKLLIEHGIERELFTINNGSVKRNY